MQTLILVFHILLAASLVGVILIQRSEGGGLGLGSGNLGGLMTTRGTANLLTRLTAILATLFFISTIFLALFFKGGHSQKSILDVATESHKKDTLPVQQGAVPSSIPSVPAAPVKETPARQSANGNGASAQSKN